MTLDGQRWSEDGILADRVRSQIGPLVKRLDQPHVHVMAADGDVCLHGEVASVDARVAIEQAAREVLGVTRVESHLRVGLGRGDSTPSSGRRAKSSPLLKQLQAVVRDGGFLTVAQERYVLRALLGVFAARLPAPARRRFLQHLPRDVRALATPAYWIGSNGASIAAPHDLVQVAALAACIDHRVALGLLQRLLPLLRDHAPMDSDIISQSLPLQLREWWLGEGSAASAVSEQREQPHRLSPVAGPPTGLPVSAVMTRAPVTIATDATFVDAFELMTHAHVHHLPVVRADGHCVAILDAVSVAKHLPEALTTPTHPLAEAGAVGPLSVLPDVPVSSAAGAMEAARVDACCVVDRHGRLVGIVTARDFITVVSGTHRHG